MPSLISSDFFWSLSPEIMIIVAKCERRGKLIMESNQSGFLLALLLYTNPQHHIKRGRLQRRIFEIWVPCPRRKSEMEMQSSGRNGSRKGNFLCKEEDAASTEFDLSHVGIGHEMNRMGWNDDDGMFSGEKIRFRRLSNEVMMMRWRSGTWKCDAYMTLIRLLAHPFTMHHDITRDMEKPPHTNYRFIISNDIIILI